MCAALVVARSRSLTVRVLRRQGLGRKGWGSTIPVSDEYHPHAEATAALGKLMARYQLDPAGWEAQLRRATKTDGKTGKLSHPVVWSLSVNGQSMSYVESPKDIASVVHMHLETGAIPSKEELSRTLQPRKARKSAASAAAEASDQEEGSGGEGGEEEGGEEDGAINQEQGSGKEGAGARKSPAPADVSGAFIKERAAAVKKLTDLVAAHFSDMEEEFSMALNQAAMAAAAGASYKLRAEEAAAEAARYKQRAEEAEAKLAGAGPSAQEDLKRKLEEVEEANAKLKRHNKKLKRALADSSDEEENSE